MGEARNKRFFDFMGRTVFHGGTIFVYRLLLFIFHLTNKRLLFVLFAILPGSGFRRSSGSRKDPKLSKKNLPQKSDVSLRNTGILWKSLPLEKTRNSPQSFLVVKRLQTRLGFSGFGRFPVGYGLCASFRKFQDAYAQSSKNMMSV